MPTIDADVTPQASPMTADAVAKLCAPFPASAISKLPKGGVQLDFVGHAAVTRRLLEVDPTWNWEPVAFDQDGLPKFDKTGGLWIRLTIAGVTRLGYGEPQGGDAFDKTKGAIGNAIRNAAMRFGVALDLWSKDDISTSFGRDWAGELAAFAFPEQVEELRDFFIAARDGGADARTLDAIKARAKELKALADAQPVAAAVQQDLTAGTASAEQQATIERLREDLGMEPDTFMAGLHSALGDDSIASLADLTVEQADTLIARLSRAKEATAAKAA